MNEVLDYVLRCFSLDSAPISCARYGCGHIHITYLVVTESGRRYILQKINENTFKDVAGLMDNITRVTAHQHSLSSDPRCALTLIPTTEGRSYISNDTGAWRVYDFVEDSLCLQLPETDEDFYQSAVGFGNFQQQMIGFPAETLHESIPNFHNTPDRYRLFKEALQRDPLGRVKEVSAEIDFYLSREAEMGILQDLRTNGKLPTRVTHNDTKLNNVLLDAKTRKALCVIDLDTVMPGLSLYDFGDSIRFGASTAKEDEKRLEKVTVSLELFRIYTRGFVKSFPGLTSLELALLPMGAKTMTLECGLRFLTDFIEGDHYFTVQRAQHNLDRSRTQMKLVQDMELKWATMQRIVEEVTK